MEKNHLSRKWGTWKSYDVSGNDEAEKLMRRYHEIGTSYGAMTQCDTPEQKEILCKVIEKWHIKNKNKLEE